MSFDHPSSTDFRTNVASAFARATRHEQDDALRLATAFIDRTFRFRGRKQDPRQAHSWPRAGAGVDGIPEEVSRAITFYAGCLLLDAASSSHREREARLAPVLLEILGDLVDDDEPFLDVPFLH